MLRIGIDFDNTIACYDQSFYKVGEMLGFIKKGDVSSKVDVKAQITNKISGDLTWQRLQGQVYGKYMHQADMFPGFLEFLYLTRLRGHKIFIVSHKTEYGHYDEERHPLREQALLWMEKKKLFDYNSLGLNRDSIFFESTRAAKVSKIRALGCTHFIDDLREVFDESNFPDETQKILFRSSADALELPSLISLGSWREITNHLFEPWTEVEVCKLLREKFADLQISQVSLKKGRGNSRIYQLKGKAQKQYALKVYPDSQKDIRPRLDNEFLVCQELSSRGYPVVTPNVKDKNLGWGIYDWVAGDVIEHADEQFLSEAINFVTRLHNDGRGLIQKNKFAPASEACLSGREIVKQIDVRLQKLKSVKSEELAAYINDEFDPHFRIVVQNARQLCGNVFDEELPLKLQILSPSDFGFHNALRDKDGRVIFIDFEYFGRDDPVKMTSDFYWHPGMNLGIEQRKWWITSCQKLFMEDLSFSMRLDSYLPLYGLKWCLIYLNEFLFNGFQNRLHADPGKVNNLMNIRFEQLGKSKKLLHEIKENW